MNLLRAQDIDTQVMDWKVPFLLCTISKYPNISENMNYIVFCVQGMGKEGYYKRILSWVDLRWHDGGNEVCILPSELFRERGNFYTFSSLIWAGQTCDRMGRMNVSRPNHKITKTVLFNHRTHFRLRSAHHKLMACIAPISAVENYPLIFYITQPGWLCILHAVQEGTEAHGRAHAFWSTSVSCHLFFLLPSWAFMIRYDRVSLLTFWP